MFDFVFLSLGAGVQSTAVLAMSNLGLHGRPRANVAIFADTQDEPRWVYEHLKFLQQWSSIPIVTVSRGQLSQDCLDRHQGRKSRFAAIPAWTRGTDGRAAPMRRQCTSEYKIEPIEKKVRELLGKAPRQRVRQRVACLLGISTDESQRIKPSRTPWITNSYPLIDARLSRTGCVNLLTSLGLPVPKKSACIFCPYHDNAFWQDLKDNHPEEFAKATAFDEGVRDMSASGVRNPVYLHRSLQPLATIDFAKLKKPPQPSLFDAFDNECEGRCGV